MIALTMDFLNAHGAMQWKHSKKPMESPMHPARRGETVFRENMRSDLTRILGGMFKDPFSHKTLVIVRAPLKKVVVHDIITGSTTHYDSAMEASIDFGCSRKRVTDMIRSYRERGSIVAGRYIVQYQDDWRRESAIC
jgi:hypothetical protein